MCVRQGAKTVGDESGRSHSAVQAAEKMTVKLGIEGDPKHVDSHLHHQLQCGSFIERGHLASSGRRPLYWRWSAQDITENPPV